MSKFKSRCSDNLKTTVLPNKHATRFWKAVNSLKGKDWDAAYSMGCMLQHLEAQVLDFLNEKLHQRKKKN